MNQTTTTGNRIDSAPTTPHRNTEVCDIVEAAVQGLNRKYGLCIQLPSPGLTPLERKSLSKNDSSGKYGREDEICRLLRFLYFQKKLDEALDDIQGKLHEVMGKWTPRSEKATTPKQRVELEVEICGTLVGLKDDALKVRKLQLPGRAEANSGVSSSSQHTSSVIEDLDRVPARRLDTSRYKLRKRALSRDDSRRPGPSESRMNSTRSTTERDSRVSASSIFTLVANDDDDDDDDDDYTSQTTVPLDGHDDIRSRVRPNGVPMDVCITEDSFPISSSGHSALLKSFSRVADSSGPPSCPPPNREPPVLRTSAYAQSSSLQDERSPQEVVDLVSSDSSGMMEVDHDAETTATQVTEAPSVFHRRLMNVFPASSDWLRTAPFVVAWEITRICQYCKVDMNTVNLQYKAEWSSSRDLDTLIRSLRQLDVLRGKPFPEKSNPKAYRAGLEQGFRTSDGKGVVFSAELEFRDEYKSMAKDKLDITTQLFSVTLKPLKLEQGCRLTRHFGSDRFLQLSIPSAKEGQLPKGVRGLGPGISDAILEWVVKERHKIAGRRWAAFFTKDITRGKKGKADTKPEHRDLIFLFAESSHDAFRTSTQEGNMPVSEMLDWLLHFDENRDQSFLKLFSRISIGLSTSYPTVVFGPHQIRYHDDLVSPSGKVMNDGIGLMSRSVAQKIRDHLDLSDVPSAVQGRLGSAKGVWLLDVADPGTEDWIQIYPSQDKWKGDLSADDDQRTLEIVSHSKELSEASLNLQFLPVFEDRAVSRNELQKVLAEKVKDDLNRDFEAQRASLESPVQFIDWLVANFPVRADRLFKDGQIQFLAGLPRGKLEVLLLLLNAGFEPKKQRYIQEKVYQMQKMKCELLENKFNIRVGCSAYVLMVVDFWGILEEDEVHLGFSNKFENGDFSDTLLHGMDVLVARSPAHFASDIQRVKAVFKPELRALKDCIVFSRKGDGPLADKLSGGDYDGDKAWVCWDQAIVQNFENADVPEQPDLRKYMQKEKTTYGDLGVGVHATEQMLHRGLRFNLNGSVLGVATNYKESYCYHAQQSASSEPAVLLSTLVGSLVDQPKQGIIFGMAQWDVFRKDFVKRFPIKSTRGRGARDHGNPYGGAIRLEPPAYKQDKWTGKGPKTNIADFLKFEVAKPAIANFLRSVNEALQPGDSSHGSTFYDADLTAYASEFEKVAQSSGSTKAILDKLRKDVDSVQEQWASTMALYAAKSKGIMSSPTSSDGDPFAELVRPIYNSWCQIEPPLNHIATIGRAFLPSLSEDPEESQWALLRASVAFKRYCERSPAFVWTMAGRQLAAIKAKMVAPRQHGVPVTLVPEMYAASGVDRKYVRQLVAARKEKATDYFAMESELGEDDLDQLDLDFLDD